MYERVQIYETSDREGLSLSLSLSLCVCVYVCVCVLNKKC